MKHEMSLLKKNDMLLCPRCNGVGYVKDDRVVGAKMREIREAEEWRIAEKIATRLFVNGLGQEAARLVLVDSNNRDLGGWCKRAVIDQIREILKT